MSYGANGKDRENEERRNPVALENQQQELKNQQEGLKNQRQELKNQQKANELQEEANRLRRRQLEAQQAANQLTSESIEVQKSLSNIQRQYYNEQIKIDSRLLEIAEEHNERERNVAFCRWCGRQMPFAQIIDYLDAEVCSLQCRKMYRQYVIDESRLMHCDCCGNDLVLEVIERDYDNVTIGTIADPSDNSRQLPVTFGDAKVLQETEMLSAIIDYWNKFQCCEPKCLAELLSKDETVIAACNHLLSRLEEYNTYNEALQKINDCCFEDALTLLSRIPQYPDASEKSESCRNLIAHYTALVDDTAAKIKELKENVNDIIEPPVSVSGGVEIKTNNIDKRFALQSASECLCQIRETFLDAVPMKHRQYKPIEDLLTYISETEDLILSVRDQKSDEKGIIMAFIAIIIFLFLCVCLGSC